MKFRIIFILVLQSVLVYSQDKDDIVNYSAVEKPFRMQKLNMAWDKARVKLTESKLQRLYSELKVQDKEELDLKRLKAENGDKDGLREAQVRKKFNGILNHYGLGGTPSTDQQDKAAHKAIFKDKKLSKLWEKAQKSGLMEEELIALKEEFEHHQEKVDEFWRMMELAENDKKVTSNEIHPQDPEEKPLSGSDHNHLSGKQKEIKQEYERLHRLATNTVPKEFEEPKVAGLWKLANEADFSEDELVSLKEELRHFETRIQKMHFLQQELKVVDERHEEDMEKSEGRKVMDKKLKKHMHDVDRLHEDLKVKIASRHAEL